MKYGTVWDGLPVRATLSPEKSRRCIRAAGRGCACLSVKGSPSSVRAP